MNRLHERVSLLTILWLSVGMMFVAILWGLIRGDHAEGLNVARFAVLVFVVAGTMFGAEVNLAIRAVNARVDDRVRHGTYQDTRIAAMERSLGSPSGVYPVVRIPGPDGTSGDRIPVLPANPPKEPTDG